jgi:hypothetical protein
VCRLVGGVFGEFVLFCRDGGALTSYWLGTCLLLDAPFAPPLPRHGPRPTGPYTALWPTTLYRRPGAARSVPTCYRLARDLQPPGPYPPTPFLAKYVILKGLVEG